MLYAVGVALRLHFRNRLALLYGYLFPTLFLLAFWVLYRYDQVPLVRHMGALLTVTILGGACFGLPTTIVSERERGVWRRYRLAPVSAGRVLAGTLAARYVLVVLAGLLQLALALALGMPAPRHPGALVVAFTLVAAALLALGLLLATLASSVPAVQALGQCLFLPMLIVGGIAVPLASLPDWAQRVSGYFPGRYAVETLQAAIAGTGLAPVRFSVAALLAIGGAALIAASARFQWDPQHRVARRGGAAWVAVALSAWVAVGVTAHVRDTRPRPTAVAATPRGPARPLQEAPRLSAQEQTAVERTPALKPASRPETKPKPKPRVAAPAAAATALEAPASWRDVTRAHIERDISFGDLPPDSGLVTPIAAPGEPPDPSQDDLLAHLQRTLPGWSPAAVDDPVQRGRNLLYVAGVADLQQLTLERHIPHIVFERIQDSTPREHLAGVLYWIAMYPEDGTLVSEAALRPLKLGGDGIDGAELRYRASIYAAKALRIVIANP